MKNDIRNVVYKEGMTDIRECMDYLLSVIAGDSTVQPLAAVLSVVAELFDEIDHLHHLRKYQHLQQYCRIEREEKGNEEK